MGLLVLTRKVGQGILIDGPARIVLVEDRPGHVAIGIDADRSVKVLREELQGKPAKANANTNAIEPPRREGAEEMRKERG